MELDLALKYRVKFGEEQQFLDGEEVQEMGKFINAAIAALGANASQEEKVLAAKAAQKKYLYEVLPGQLVPVRISRFLLQTAVNMRYQTAPAHPGQPAQVSIPRKAEGKTRPGIWWGEIMDHLDTDELEGTAVLATSLPLEPMVAAWIVRTVWEDDRVQNGFPPQLQHWVNTFDQEMRRLSKEIGGGRNEE